MLWCLVKRVSQCGSYSGYNSNAEQSRLLSRKVRRATFLLDSDDAGIMAALKGCFVLLSQNIEPYVALLPEGVDPDEMALRSRNKLSEILSAPITCSNFWNCVLQDTSVACVLQSFGSTVAKPEGFNYITVA